MQKGISIIICTYNGAKRLPQTLQHIAQQQVSADLQWQLIVVDNNSNDDTSAIVQAEWDRYASAPPLILLHQPTPGVSYAREKGLKAVAYSYVIICDDDNWLAPNYIETVIRILDNNKKIGIVGGWSKGKFEIEPPVWFNKFATAYAVGQRRKESTPIDWLATAGVGIRKEALDKLNKLNFEQILSGRQGKILLAGDDLELCAAIRAIGYEVYFSTELSFVHFMTAGRLNWQYFKRMVYNQSSVQSVFGMYSIAYRLLKEDKPASFKSVHKILWRDILAPVKAKCKTFRKTLRFLKSLLLEKEGDSTGYLNRYYISYLKYLILHKREMKKRYALIANFYDRIKSDGDL